MVLTDEQVRIFFGDPTLFVLADGGISPAWERTILTQIALPRALPIAWNPTITTSLIRVHRKVAPFFEQAFTAINVAGLWDVGLKEYGGCYAWRPNRNNAASLSRHCWGIAIDLNPRTNPNGGPGDMHPGVVAAFKQAGFAWGGDFTHTKDLQHFEYCDAQRLVGGPQAGG